MNSFKDIRLKFGQETLLKARDLEKCEKSLARHRNHLVFSLRCKDENVIPPSLRIKCPVRSENARRIVERARKGLLNERIRENNRSIDYLKKTIEDKKEALSVLLPEKDDVT